MKWDADEVATVLVAATFPLAIVLFIVMAVVLA